MKKITYIFIYIFSCSLLYAQGFDWQYSARMPFDSPVMFVGLIGEFNHLIHNGNIQLVESSITCDTFKTGIGEGYSAGVAVEYWLDGLTALTFSGSYNFSPGKFTVQADSLPRIGGGKLLTEYEFTSKIAYLIIEPGIKYRLFDSHFHVGAGLQFGILMSNSSLHKEKIIGDENEPPFTNGSYERILDGRIGTINSIILQPKIRIGYDLTFGLGKYATPNISIGIPVLNLTQSSEWKRWTFSAGLTIFWGM